MNISDPVSRVGTPFEERMSRTVEMKEAYKKLYGAHAWRSSYYEPSFSIGFSKRGLNKLLKDPSIVIKYNNEGKIVFDTKED